jgi:hypothetical protein
MRLEAKHERRPVISERRGVWAANGQGRTAGETLGAACFVGGGTVSASAIDLYVINLLIL